MLPHLQPLRLQVSPFETGALKDSVRWSRCGMCPPSAQVKLNHRPFVDPRCLHSPAVDPVIIGLLPSESCLCCHRLFVCLITCWPLTKVAFLLLLHIVAQRKIKMLRVISVRAALHLELKSRCCQGTVLSELVDCIAQGQGDVHLAPAYLIARMNRTTTL